MEYYVASNIFLGPTLFFIPKPLNEFRMLAGLNATKIKQYKVH